MSEKSMSYEYELLETKPQKVICVKATSSTENLFNTVMGNLEKIWNYFEKLGITVSGYAFAGYWSTGPDEFELEIGYIVEKDISEMDNIIMSEIPAGKYVSVLHTGPYSEHPGIYEDITKWMDEKGYKQTKKFYKYYLTDPSVTPLEENQTRISFQIAE